MIKRRSHGRPFRSNSPLIHRDPVLGLKGTTALIKSVALCGSTDGKLELRKATWQQQGDISRKLSHIYLVFGACGRGTSWSSTSRLMRRAQILGQGLRFALRPHTDQRL